MHVFSTLIGSVGLLALEASAFPAIAASLNAPEKLEKRVLGIAPGFNAQAQLVDVTGEHAFTPPDFDAGDLRGPCPGLNALANHNYLPHNGVATLTQFIAATEGVFGMGTDLAAFLAVYGAVMDGDGTSWSIGGPPPSSLTSLAPGVLGYPQGISGSHNKYESDASPTRGDLYEYGNDYLVQLPYFQQLYDMQADAAEPNYNLDVLGDFRSLRYDQSVENNPYFFYGPFTGPIVSQAAFTFIYRFMANKSAEAPEGILNKEVLKSFFAISGDDDNLVYTPGYERIPDNWYKRAIGDEYTIPFFQLDLVSFILRFPKLLSIGGNTGTVNSFTGVDITNLTGGVYNAQTLMEGNNLACFAFQAAAQAEPDVSLALVSDLTSTLDNVMSELSCPKLEAINEAQFGDYPGYTKLKTGGTYKK